MRKKKEEKKLLPEQEYIVRAFRLDVDFDIKYKAATEHYYYDMVWPADKEKAARKLFDRCFDDYQRAAEHGTLVRFNRCFLERLT